MILAGLPPIKPNEKRGAGGMHGRTAERKCMPAHTRDVDGGGERSSSHTFIQKGAAPAGSVHSSEGHEWGHVRSRHAILAQPNHGMARLRFVPVPVRPDD